ncbi:hypothetical protein Bca52824_033293, partial [Brassica carinata]
MIFPTSDVTVASQKQTKQRRRRRKTRLLERGSYEGSNHRVGDQFSELGKRILKQQQLHEVADIVKKSDHCKYTKTYVQCKNMIDTVKKKYKQLTKTPPKVLAQGRLSQVGSSSCIGVAEDDADRVPSIDGECGRLRSWMTRSITKGSHGVVLGAQSSGPMRLHFKKRGTYESESEPEPEPSPDSVESLPPQPSQPLPKRLKMDDSGKSG